MDKQTKGSIEAEIAATIVRLQREQQGRGAAEVKAFLLGDMVVVRCSGVFTPTESRLVGTEEGRRLVREAREELRNIVRSDIEAAIAQIAGCDVLRSYCDLSVDAAEQVEMFVLSVDVEKQLLRRDLDRLKGLIP